MPFLEPSQGGTSTRMLMSQVPWLAALVVIGHLGCDPQASLEPHQRAEGQPDAPVREARQATPHVTAAFPTAGRKPGPLRRLGSIPDESDTASIDKEGRCLARGPGRV